MSSWISALSDHSFGQIGRDTSRSVVHTSRVSQLSHAFVPSFHDDLLSFHSCSPFVQFLTILIVNFFFSFYLVRTSPASAVGLYYSFSHHVPQCLTKAGAWLQFLSNVHLHVGGCLKWRFLLNCFISWIFRNLAGWSNRVFKFNSYHERP